MTAATATPQMMRDRLLQAVDGQSNVCNMMVVVEVISVLEKYPITKEALEETRLGKLINDIRKKTKNEDLAKRAKKLLRNWQKLIEPGKGELLSRGLTGASWSSTSRTHPCISPPAAIASSGKAGLELKDRSDFNNCTPSLGKVNNRKRKGDQKEGQLVLAKIPQTIFDVKIQNSKQMSTNGLNGYSKIVTNIQAHYSLEREMSEPVVKSKLNKIPIHAVKPHTSAPGYKSSNASCLLQGLLLQQQATKEQAASGGQYRPRSPQFSWQGTETLKQESVIKEIVPQEKNIHSPSVRADVWSADVESQSRSSSCSEVISLDSKGPTCNMVKTKRQKYRPKDYLVNLDGPVVEDCTKPVRLKDRRITFDVVTGQIKPSCQKDLWDGNISMGNKHGIQLSEQLNQNQPVPPSPFQQADWKELSKSEIIQAYLSQQSTVLTSSGARATGAHFFMAESLKKEEHCCKDAKNVHILQSNPPSKELPGVNREIGNEDMKRLHTQHWSGVNGCYDTMGNWYDWTECISLDLHGDESRLNILPYVCLDYV